MEQRRGKLISVALLFTFILLLPSVSRGEEQLVGPAYTYFTFAFAENGELKPGVTAVLIDSANREWNEISDSEGIVRFAIKAKSGMAFLTYWEEKTVPVYRKAFEYTAGNHYSFSLNLRKEQ
jgi:hypothetical protein